MLFRKLFITFARDYKLVLTWLTPINVIVSVEKRSIVYHKRHLIPLVYNLEVSIKVQRGNLDLPVICRQDLGLVSGELDELLRHDVVHLDLTYVQCCTIALPNLMLHQIVLLVSEHNRNLAFACKQLHSFIK